MRQRVRLAGIGITLVLAGTLVACGSGGSAGADDGPAIQPSTDSSPLVTQAKAEGTVVWYTSADPKTTQVVQTDFKKAYGITVTIVKLPAATVEQRFVTEAKSGRPGSDVVFSPDSVWLASMAQQQDLVPLSASNLPNIADYPSRFVLDKAAVVTTINLVAGAYNTSRIPSAPKSYADLLAPQYKGKLLLVDPRQSAAQMGFFDALYRDPKLGAGYLRSLAAQAPKYSDSAAAATESISSGASGVLVNTFAGNTRTDQDAGAPIKGFPWQAPVVANLGYLAATAKAPHPAAAELFLQWALSKQGQTAYNTVSDASSALGALPGTVTLPTSGLVYIDNAQAAKDSDAIVKLLNL